MKGLHILLIKKEKKLFSEGAKAIKEDFLERNTLIHFENIFSACSERQYMGWEDILKNLSQTV
jgi:hypothetical protein